MVNMMTIMHFSLPITPPHLSFCSSSSKNQKENKSFKMKIVLKKGLLLMFPALAMFLMLKNVTFSVDNKEIHVLNDSIDCLSLTLSHYAIDHKRNSYFKRNKLHICMHILHGMHKHTMLLCMLECVHIHIKVANAIL